MKREKICHLFPKFNYIGVYMTRTSLKILVICKDKEYLSYENPELATKKGSKEEKYE
jgi:hypothetical protein